MPRTKPMPAESPLMLTPMEAAALDQLLAAYLCSNTGDPGILDLKSVRQKLLGISQNHLAYATWRNG
jgi:hypothetical protein